MKKLQSRKTYILQSEMPLLESSLMIFCIVLGRRSVVQELSGYYQLQCIVASILLSTKCFQKFRFTTYCKKMVIYFLLIISLHPFLLFMSCVSILSMVLCSYQKIGGLIMLEIPTIDCHHLCDVHFKRK